MNWVNVMKFPLEKTIKSCIIDIEHMFYILYHTGVGVVKGELAGRN
jgi:hypothetical protein